MVAPEPDDEAAGRRLAALALATGLVALVLYAVQQALRLPSGFGVEDLLGWSSKDAVTAAVRLWCGDPPHLRWPLAGAYLLLDSSLFMPLYALLALELGRAVSQALAPGRSWFGEQLVRYLRPAAVLALVALLGVDTLENYGGARRIGLPAWAWPSCALLGAVTGVVLNRLLHETDAARRRRLGLAGAAAVLLGLAVVATLFLRGRCAYGLSPATPFAWAHAAKPWLIDLAFGLPLVGALSWWFGTELHLELQRDARRLRAARRAGAMGVIGRSRYVLAMVALFGALTLGLDQCRDVLLALADVAGGPPLGAGGWAWRLTMLALTPLAAAVFSYTCWQWARLVGMVQRPGLELPGGDEVVVWVGRFARLWARALALLPLVLLALLTSRTLGDAVIASQLRGGDPDLWVTGWRIGMLAGFGLGSVAIGIALLTLRQQLALSDPRHYYNAESDVMALLWGRSSVQTAPGRHRLPQPLSLLSRLFTPVMLTPLVLLAIVLVRLGPAHWPDTAAAAPAALALFALSLCWWQAVLGTIAMIEQRHAFPWIVLPVLLMGALSALDWTNNHALPWPVPGRFDAAALDAALVGLRHDGVAATGTLAVLGGTLWLLAVWSRRHAVNLMPGWTWQFQAARVALGTAALALALALLHHLDRDAGVLEAPPQPLRTPVPAFADMLEGWMRQLPEPRPDDARVFMVAAEGGGIRSAYWTALVLARYHEEVPDFDRRLFAVSGVSGGAVGAAVYRACLRQTQGAATGGAARHSPLRACVEGAFDRLDALTPLLAGLVFDDPFARLLPLPIGDGALRCRHAGCGHLSRALGFEREWIRVLPAMVEPLAPAAPSEPQLLLNGTWVETGSRSVAASFAFDRSVLPSAESLRRRLHAEPSLITGAHTAARFPFINPLAAVQPPPGTRGLRGHVADGGYFDNSGATSLQDLWRPLERRLAADGKGRWPQVILVRNGETLPQCERPSARNPPPECVSIRPSAPADPATLDRPGARQRLNLYVDLLGPPVTLLNVAGTGAHGRQAVATLRGDLGEPSAPCPRIVLRDQLEDGSLVPLGWYLSRPARETLQSQADALQPPANCPPGL